MMMEHLTFFALLSVAFVLASPAHYGQNGLESSEQVLSDDISNHIDKDENHINKKYNKVKELYDEVVPNEEPREHVKDNEIHGKIIHRNQLEQDDGKAEHEGHHKSTIGRFKKFFKKVKNAAKSTYKEERESLLKSVHSVEKAGKDIYEAGKQVAQTGRDLKGAFKKFKQKIFEKDNEEQNEDKKKINKKTTDGQQ